MERRDFLALCATTAAAASALAAAPVAGATLPEPSAPLPPPADMDAYLARVDAGFARIGAWSPRPAGTPTSRESDDADSLARTALQSIFLTGMLGDLPIPLQLDERMQDRMWRAMPLLDDAHDRMSAFLTSRTDEDFARVQTALRSTGARQRIIADLDVEAARTGVSAARRAQLRAMLDHVTWRLANQPPTLLVNEYLEKMEKVVETDVESEARQRHLAARIGEEAFWLAAEKSKRDKRIGRGAKVFGIGLLIFGAGAAIVTAGAFEAVFVMTAGVITMLVGLVTLLLGLATPQEKAPTSVSG